MKPKIWKFGDMWRCAGRKKKWQIMERVGIGSSPIAAWFMWRHLI